MSRRLAFAALLAAAMVALEEVAQGAFVSIVAVALLIAPVFPWFTLARLHRKVRAEERTAAWRADPVETLISARNGMFLKAIGTSVTASLALFVVGREFGWFAALDRTQFLMLIAYPPLLSPVVAIDWLRTLRKLDR